MYCSTTIIYTILSTWYLQEEDRQGGDAGEAHVESDHFARVGQPFAGEQRVPAEHLAVPRADCAYNRAAEYSEQCTLYSIHEYHTGTPHLAFVKC